MPRWTRIAPQGECRAASCPAIYLSDDGHLFVQGRRPSVDERSELRLGPEEDAVIVPRTLFLEATGALHAPGRRR